MVDPDIFNLEDRILKKGLAEQYISGNEHYIDLFSTFLDLDDFEKIKNKIIGSGRIGGKAAGIILAEQMLKKNGSYLGFDINFPPSWFVGSGVFRNFLKVKKLEKYEDAKYFSETKRNEIYRSYLRDSRDVPFPDDVVYGVDMLLEETNGTPLVIRSSSWLEDSFGASFAGLYESHFIPNVFDHKTNRKMFFDAMRRIFASVWNTSALEYRRDHKDQNLITEYEAMALLVQKVVGQEFRLDGMRYYLPLMGGICFSYDDSAREMPDAGFIQLGAGLGTVVVNMVEDHYLPGGNLQNGIPSLDPSIVDNLDVEDRGILDYSPNYHLQRFIHVIDLQEKEFDKTVKSLEFHNIMKGMASLDNIDQVVSLYYGAGSSRSGSMYPATPFSITNPPNNTHHVLGFQRFNQIWRPRFEKMVKILEFSYADEKIRKYLNENKWDLANEVKRECPPSIQKLIEEDSLLDFDTNAVKEWFVEQPNRSQEIIYKLERLVETKKLLESMNDYPLFEKEYHKMKQTYLKREIYNILRNNAVDTEWAITDNSFYLVQCRPLIVKELDELSRNMSSIKEENILFDVDGGTPNWEILDVEYIIWIDAGKYLHNFNQRDLAAKQISRLNKEYKDKRFILMLPGRVGNIDNTLGVRVNYEDINHSLSITETPLPPHYPEFSEGRHFGVTLREKPIRYFPLTEKDTFNQSLLLNNVVEQYYDGMLMVSRLPTDIIMSRSDHRIIAEIKKTI